MTLNLYNWEVHNYCYSVASHGTRTQRLPCSRHEESNFVAGLPRFGRVGLESRVPA